jgi:hypothetical protein
MGWSIRYKMWFSLVFWMRFLRVVERVSKGLLYAIE